MKDKPNILFLICDDLNLAISRLGWTPFAPTPNLERLMDRGVTFSRAVTNCPICLPARNSLFSGLYPHSTGHYTLWDDWRTVSKINTTTPDRSRYQNIQPLLGSTRMMPDHFKRNGYKVHGSGKVYHQGAQNLDWWHEFDRGADYGPAFYDGFKTEQQRHMFEADEVQAYLHRYRGIDRFFVGEKGPRFEVESCFAPLGEYLKTREEPAKCGDMSPYRYVSDEDRDPLPDELTAAYGEAFLKQKHEDPFFLALGFVKPHTPLNVPQAYFDRFPLDEVELPPWLEDDLEDCARAHREHRPWGFLSFAMKNRGGDTGDLYWRKWVQAYLANISFLDEQIGRVLDALEASPYAEDTVIVFTSDNGYHMGEKSFIFKDTLWNEASRIPLIIAPPQCPNAGKVCEHPVAHIDVYPTLIDLAGLPGEPNESTHGYALEGHSLRPFLETPDGKEWAGPDCVLTSVRGDTGIHHAILTQTHRFILCGNGEEELYDHREDPWEWNNLAHDPTTGDLRFHLREQTLKLLGQEPHLQKRWDQNMGKV